MPAAPPARQPDTPSSGGPGTPASGGPTPGGPAPGGGQRRRRRVVKEQTGAAETTSQAVHEPEVTAPWSAADQDPGAVDRGLRGLVGSGSSQVTPSAALRARDAARPRPEDLARAEAQLQVIRRHWTPRD